MIHWFPGHMAKARREIEENLKLVDLVIELADARLPITSQNPLLQKTIGEKPKIVALMKADLADPIASEKWLKYFTRNSITAIFIDVNDEKTVNNLIQSVHRLGMEQQEKLIRKGMNPRPIRAIIAGIPNVGKSTLINRLANKKIARIGDRPGITRHQQWIKVRGKFELLDTPGMLWQKFADEEIGLKLAAIGTIKHELIPTQDVAAYIINYLLQHKPQEIIERYSLTEKEDMWEIFVQIGKSRGALESGGNVNFDKVAEVVLQDFRAAKLGRITLDLLSE